MICFPSSGIFRLDSASFTHCFHSQGQVKFSSASALYQEVPAKHLDPLLKFYPESF